MASYRSCSNVLFEYDTVVLLLLQLRGLNEVLLNRTKVGTEGVTGTPKSLKERAEKEVRVKHYLAHPMQAYALYSSREFVVSVVASCTFRGAIRSFKPRRRKLMSAKTSI